MSDFRLRKRIYKDRYLSNKISIRSIFARRMIVLKLLQEVSLMLVFYRGNENKFRKMINFEYKYNLKLAALP